MQTVKKMWVHKRYEHLRFVFVGIWITLKNKYEYSLILVLAIDGFLLLNANDLHGLKYKRLKG